MAKASSAASRVGVAPGMQIPLGVEIKQAAPPLPPDLAEAIEAARKSGRYMIAVVSEAGDDGTLSVHANRVGLNPDFLLRGWHGVARMMLDGSLAGIEHAAPGEKREAAT